jgi:predicted ATPase/class 3 adenylate cyclase
MYEQPGDHSSTPATEPAASPLPPAPAAEPPTAPEQRRADWAKKTHLMARELPAGTVTFLFTDVEGSTRLLHELGPEAYAQALSEHRRVLRKAFERRGGVEVDTQGDAFFVAFPTAPGALAAAHEAKEALAIPVRMGIHTGTPLLTEEGYVGEDVHKAARIAAAGHGGQVLVSAASAALLADPPRDLGEHRLKDLSAPERIYQAGQDEFPPLKTLYRTNLPVLATPFLGREHELAEVRELLARDDVRLLTLTGPGGTGKTRLGLQAAAEVADEYLDGVFWVPLAPLRDPGLVLEQAAQAVGAKYGLTEHVADKRLLLLLDNLEHLIEASDGLSDLLASCPNLRVLVTSRELLRLPGEQVYPVPPLEPEDGTHLFVARARAAKPDFKADDALPELCARLDNLPLALELAAARVRILTSEQLLERLAGRLDLLKAGRGVDPRQQTLRATIEWSHGLLDEEEQRLFAGLAVFRGGCRLESAEEVCEADLDTLQSLVDKSLVRHTEERFWMLETIRDYALERLEASGTAGRIRRRHADHLLEMARDLSPDLARGHKLALDRVEADLDNIRSALRWALDVDEVTLALDLAGELGNFWIDRDHEPEARRWFEEAFERDAAVPDPVRGKGLMCLGIACAYTGSEALAINIYGEALRLFEGLGDDASIAWAIGRMGDARHALGEIEEARLSLEKSLALSEQVGDQALRLSAVHHLGQAELEGGNRARARTLFEEAASLARDLGSLARLAAILHGLGDLALDDGEVEHAESLYRGALQTAAADEADRPALYCLGGLSATAAARGRPARAGLLWGALERLQREFGLPIQAGEKERYEGVLVALRNDPAFFAGMREGRGLDLNEAVAYAISNA